MTQAYPAETVGQGKQSGKYADCATSASHKTLHVQLFLESHTFECITALSYSLMMGQRNRPKFGVHVKITCVMCLKRNGKKSKASLATWSIFPLWAPAWKQWPLELDMKWPHTTFLDQWHGLPSGDCTNEHIAWPCVYHLAKFVSANQTSLDPAIGIPAVQEVWPLTQVTKMRCIGPWSASWSWWPGSPNLMHWSSSTSHWPWPKAMTVLYHSKNEVRYL